MGSFLKPNESYQEYRDRAVDSISPTFCGAKWYNASIWLNNGMTTSCHHPPAHKIPLDELKKSIKALHNTEYKKLVRHQMLIGEQPKECDYCWRVEAMGKEVVSDRVYKSVIYSDEDLQKCAFDLGAYADVDLKTLEIAFDSNCNFACSYCNPSFSTSWQGDVKSNGPYQNLVSDGAAAFQQDGAWTIPYGLKNVNNPYIEAFWKWWEGDLQHSLEELRITGGEATMSPEFWKLMDWWKNHPDCNVALAVNSNLGAKQSLIVKLAEASRSFKKFDLYTSNESFGGHAEYIRDGLVWDEWVANIDLMMEQGKMSAMHCMLTLNSLCLFSLPQFLDTMFEIKDKYKTKSPYLSFNILRFPSFMSIVTLPKHIRLEECAKIEAWYEQNKSRKYFEQFEKDGLERLISYIKNIEEGHSNTSSIESRERDFKSFFMQYDNRRNKNFEETFASNLTLIEWYKSIPITNTAPLTFFKNGDSSKFTDSLAAELKLQAENEGWILNPTGVNPGSQHFNESKND